MKYLFYYIFLGFILFSCSTSKKNPHITSFDKMTPEQKDFFRIAPPAGIDTSLNDKIQIVTGKQFKDLMATEDKALLYMWDPDCRDLNCLTPEAFVNLCATTGYAPFIVMDYLNTDVLYRSYKHYGNLYSINTDYYDYMKKRNPKEAFLLDITSNNFPYNMKQVRYLMFRAGRYYNAYQNPIDVH